MFRSETLGGERFYLIAEKLIEEPRKHVGVLELLYTLLSLGFEGQYYGPLREKRDQIKNHLYQIISQIRGKVVKQLSTHWQDNHTLQMRTKRKSFIKKFCISTLGILCLLYAYYSYAIYENNAINNQLFNSIAHKSSITTYSQLINRDLFNNKSI